MPVNDNGNEVLRKAAVDNNDGSYTLKTLDQGLEIPDHDSASFAYPDTITETITFKNGGIAGTTVATLTLIYTDATKEKLSSYALVEA